jgi:nucleolar complex protein 2
MESAKHVVWRTYEGINFMINCITELCNMNMNQGY